VYVYVIVSHHYVNNKFSSYIYIWSRHLSFKLFHIQQIIVVCHWIWIESINKQIK
jgi:hypothetical protein